MDIQLYFDKRSTMMIKGIAIILMVCNHLFPIPEWIYPENKYISILVGGKSIAAYFGGFSKVCVAMFAVLSGMGLYYNYSKGMREGYHHTIRKLPPFFLTYWVILILVYLPIMLIAGLIKVEPVEFILNLFGYQTTYCRIAWYVRFYLEVILTFPIWVAIDNKLSKCSCFLKKGFAPALIIIGIQWLTHVIIVKLECSINTEYILEYFFYIPIVMMGYYIAKTDFFDLLQQKLRPLLGRKGSLYILMFFTVLLCFVGRGVVKQAFGLSFDLFYAPAIIFVGWLFSCIVLSNKIREVLVFLGKYSLEIWFLHAVFFVGNPMIQKIGYWPRYWVFILVWVITLLLPIAMIIKIMVRKILLFNSCVTVRKNEP